MFWESVSELQSAIYSQASATPREGNDKEERNMKRGAVGNRTYQLIRTRQWFQSFWAHLCFLVIAQVRLACCTDFSIYNLARLILKNKRSINVYPHRNARYISPHLKLFYMYIRVSVRVFMFFVWVFCWGVVEYLFWYFSVLRYFVLK